MTEQDDWDDDALNPCAFCDQDPCRCYNGARQRLLTPEEVLRAGVLTLEQEASGAVDHLLVRQGRSYRVALREHGPEILIEALLARDRQLAQMARQFADGRTASRLLREFMRGMLLESDHAGLSRALAVSKAGKVELVLEALGAEPADARMLKKHGSTLGPLEQPEERMRGLVSGERKE